MPCVAVSGSFESSPNASVAISSDMVKPMLPSIAIPKTCGNDKPSGSPSSVAQGFRVFLHSGGK